MKNNNYPTWLVSLEIAIKLKEIGFDKPSPFVLQYGEVQILTCYDFWHAGVIDIEVTIDKDLERVNSDETTVVPTWEQVFEWFRSKGYHGVIAARGEDGENEYSYCIDYLNELSSDFEQDSHLTYEEAREALIKALIRTYKNEQL
jgi:hypothetical protein